MKRLALIFIIFLAFTSTYAQDLQNLIKGSSADANYLTRGYVSPILNSIGAGFAQGWYNTAKTHKLVGFDLTVTASGIYFPSSDLSFKVENTKLTNLQVNVPPSTATSVDAPTILGSSTAPTYQLKANGVVVPGATVPGTPGLDLKKEGLSFIPTAMVQLGIGLPKGTDLKIRFFPSTKVGNGSISLFGFGVMHDIKQHIPGIKHLPFDLSALVGYNSAKFDLGLDSSKPDQRAIFESTATTIQGVISKKLSVVTFYGGLGYNFTSTSLAMKGKYTIDNLGLVTLTDPVNFSISQSGPRFTAGMRLKLAIFSFHGDYTFQQYNALTVGFGLSIR